MLVDTSKITTTFRDLYEGMTLHADKRVLDFAVARLATELESEGVDRRAFMNECMPKRVVPQRRGH